MSNQTNTNLLERAAELIDHFASHPAGLDDQLIQAVDANDLQEIYRLVTLGESIRSQENYHGYEVNIW